MAAILFAMTPKMEGVAPWQPPRNVIVRMKSTEQRGTKISVVVVKSLRADYPERASLLVCRYSCVPAYEEGGKYFRDSDDAEVRFEDGESAP